MATAFAASFFYALLSTVVLVRLGRRPGARGREERILIYLGWVLVGLSAGLFLVLMTLAAATLSV